MPSGRLGETTSGSIPNPLSRDTEMYVTKHSIGDVCQRRRVSAYSLPWWCTLSVLAPLFVLYTNGERRERAGKGYTLNRYCTNQRQQDTCCSWLTPRPSHHSPHHGLSNDERKKVP